MNAITHEKSCPISAIQDTFQGSNTNTKTCARKSRVTCEKTATLNQVSELFLRAFIGTSSPLKVFSFGKVVIPYPMAFPELVFAEFDRMKHMRAFQVKQDTPLLPAPQIAGLLPAPKSSYTIGQIVPVSGISQTCELTQVFDQFGSTWARLKHPYGVAYRKLSSLEPSA